MSESLIVVPTAPGALARRQACLQTWIPDALALGWDVRFFICSGDPTQPAVPQERGVRTVLCPGFEGDLARLRDKLWWAYRWARERYQRVFKCDDDTYVAADRLTAAARDAASYQGLKLSDDQPIACGGAGYFLDRRGLDLAIAGMKTQLPAPGWHPGLQEDQCVGRALREAGLPVRHDSRFHQWLEQGVPGRDNDTITAHRVDPERMLWLHAEYHNRFAL